MESEGWIGMLLNLPLVLCMFDFSGNYPLDAGLMAMWNGRGRKADLVCIFQYFDHLILVHFLLVTWLDNPKN